jgi:ring-1,2-phenylacetyl-CoA epoxidase subunit PaaD
MPGCRPRSTSSGPTWARCSPATRWMRRLRPAGSRPTRNRSAPVMGWIEAVAGRGDADRPRQPATPSSGGKTGRAYRASGPSADADAVAAARLSGGDMVTVRPAPRSGAGSTSPRPGDPGDLARRSRHRAGHGLGGRHADVTVTPTYSGCPATAVINGYRGGAARPRHREPDARDASSRRPGPPTGSAKRAARGWRNTASPRPNPRAGRALPALRRHPISKRISQFGSTPCKAQWRCRDCLEPFDYFKCI